MTIIQFYIEQQLLGKGWQIWKALGNIQDCQADKQIPRGRQDSSEDGYPPEWDPANTLNYFIKLWIFNEENLYNKLLKVLAQGHSSAKNALRPKQEIFWCAIKSSRVSKLNIVCVFHEITDDFQYSIVEY